ncbi:MAG: alpha-L-rhamnosidase C-terminal domain-containing protein [Victivallaceae bacterium]|nr:alpha-L-rhamnosidase C-terminal domain-containing protein [Victivallaceae bacterium]
MDGLRMPARIDGEWIWKDSIQDNPEVFLLLRKEFVCGFVGIETTIWITARSAYQLFINGRFIGFGPRAHQDPGISYVDQYDITFYLEAGINVVSIIASCSKDNSAPGGTPGVWAQLAMNNQPTIKTDSSWFILEGKCFSGNRARFTADGSLTQMLRSNAYPQHWMMPTFSPDSRWSHPDLLSSPNLRGGRLELHPLPPPAIAEDSTAVTPVCHGTVTDVPNWTQVFFPNRGNGRDTYAGCCYIHSDRVCDVPVKIFSDDRFKLFCNGDLVSAGNSRNGERGDVLPLGAGWNRLIFFQTPRQSSMGLFMLLSDVKGMNPIRIRRQPSEQSQEAWRIAGPLKLSIDFATPSVDFDRLSTEDCRSEFEDITDPHALLSNATFKEVGKCGDDQPGLSKSDYQIFKLDTMRYGFIKVAIDAMPGDIVDVSIGLRRSDNGYVAFGGLRAIGTVYCTTGHNFMLSMTPADCYYVCVSVREAQNVVRVNSVSFSELVQSERHECEFRSSDEMLNRFWEIGRQTMRRSAAFIPLGGSHEVYDCYMLDAYIDAVNMAAVYGDFEYSSVRLRQFLDAQLENGELPALSHGRGTLPQLVHMFFFPVWALYNYHFSGNVVELERTAQALPSIVDYFEMLTDRNGLLVDIDPQMSQRSPISPAKFPRGAVPTFLNALYCRFLLSSEDIFRLIGRDDDAQRCIESMHSIAKSLQDSNFNPKEQLFCRWQCAHKDSAEYNLFANFCAMFGGVMPLEEFEHFFNSFFNFDPPFDHSEESRSPYFHFLFMEMMFALGQRDWAFRYFRDYWSRRISEVPGAWNVEPDSPWPMPTRFSNGCCISPNVFLLREVLGVRIAEPGHRAIFFNPAFHQLDWAEGTIPMARGRLKVKWELLTDGSLDVTLDANVPVKVVPEMSHAQLRNTSFRLGENITLLDPPAEMVDD